MTAQTKLTDTQTTIPKAAASRADGNIEPLPAALRGGARAKVIEGLLARGLIVDADGNYLLTDAGYAAVGKCRPVPKGIQKLEATSRTIRPGTKLAAIIDAMRHPGGATIAQMMVGTGWQATPSGAQFPAWSGSASATRSSPRRGRTGSGPIASPDCKPPKGLRTPQALFCGQIPRWPFCHFPALKSPGTRASTGRKGGDRFSVPRA